MTKAMEARMVDAGILPRPGVRGCPEGCHAQPVLDQNGHVLCDRRGDPVLVAAICKKAKQKQAGREIQVTPSAECRLLEWSER